MRFTFTIYIWLAKCAVTCVLHVHFIYMCIFFLHGPFVVPYGCGICCQCGYFISITTQQWQKGRGKIIEAFFIFWESIGNNLNFPVVTIAAATKAHVIFMSISDSPRLGLLEHARRYIALLTTLRNLRHNLPQFLIIRYHF